MVVALPPEPACSVRFNIAYFNLRPAVRDAGAQPQCAQLVCAVLYREASFHVDDAATSVLLPRSGVPREMTLNIRKAGRYSTTLTLSPFKFRREIVTVISEVLTGMLMSSGIWHLVV
jgi:hypothetical protein